MQEQQAWAEVSDLRNAARRFADETGLDEGRSMNFIFDAKTPDSYIRDKCHNALLIGDWETANDIRKSMESATDVMALRASMRSRQPLKVGGVENKEAKAAFSNWLKERRPHEHTKLLEVQSRYEKAAYRAGLKVN